MYLRFIPPKDPVEHDATIPVSINAVRSKYPNDNKRQERNESLIHELFFNKIVEYNDIIDNLWQVFYNQRHSFNINISFGYVFEQDIDEKKGNLHFGKSKYNYFIGHGYNDQSVLQQPELINNKSDFQNLF